MAPPAPRHVTRPRSYAEPPTDSSDSEIEESFQSDASSIANTRFTASPRQLRVRPSVSRQSVNSAKRNRATATDDEEQITYESPKEKKARLKASRPTSLKIKPKRPSATYNKLLSATVAPPHNGDGTKPPWIQLPYFVWEQIFEHAAYPTVNPKTFQATKAVDWLVKTSRTCKALVEPALSVLYRNPPMAPMIHAHELARLLSAEEQQLMQFNYRAKVERVHMEVSQTAEFVLQRHGVLDLHRLIYNMPRLKELELYHKDDLAPYHHLESTSKWRYPESMFSALDKNVNGEITRLESWRWSGRLAANIPIADIIRYHQRPSFVNLTKLAVTNFCPNLKDASGSNDGETDEPELAHELANAICALEHLSHLVLESSTIVNSILMPLLPPLRHLELINCWEVTSDDLVAYLERHGAGVRQLTLNHNISLNMSFLTQLATFCPNLVSLRMSLQYFSVHPTYRNFDPAYTVLLEDHEVPDWPSALQVINLTHLGTWQTSTARRFFHSLLSASEKLKDLRQLKISSNLDIGWRDRVTFRKQWIEPFPRVFRRVSKPPTVRPSVTSEKRQSAKEAIKIASDDDDDVPLARRTTRVKRTAPNSGDDNVPLSKRLTRAKRAAQLPSSTDARLGASSSSGDDQWYIQGMCDMVDVSISNLRPAETQFTGADFVDTEPEDDEEWDGRDVLVTTTTPRARTARARRGGHAW